MSTKVTAASRRPRGASPFWFDGDACMKTLPRAGNFIGAPICPPYRANCKVGAAPSGALFAGAPTGAGMHFQGRESQARPSMRYVTLRCPATVAAIARSRRDAKVAPDPAADILQRGDFHRPRGAP